MVLNKELNGSSSPHNDIIDLFIGTIIYRAYVDSVI
jgi:hypothetical protein